MISDDGWEQFKQGVTPLKRTHADLYAQRSRPTADEVLSRRKKAAEKAPAQKARPTEDELLPRRSLLAEAIAVGLYKEQSANLISRIYSLPGDGKLPMSGGKMELSNRNRLFKR